MAFPTSISATTDVLADTKRRVKPFISSGGNVYVIAPSGTTGGQGITAYKATDPTSSFSSVGTGPSFTNLESMHATQDGDIIYVVSIDSDPIVEFHEFNMGTDTWDTTNETVEDISGKDAPTAVTSYWATIAYRDVSGDELVIAYSGQVDANMGTDYDRVDFAHKDKTATSWTGPVAMDAGGGAHYRYPGAQTGTNNKVHVIWDTTTQIQGRSISTTNTLSTQANITAGASLGILPGGTADVSGTQHLIFSCADNANGNGQSFIAEEDGSDNLSWGGTNLSFVADAAINIPALDIAVEPGTSTFHAIFSDQSNDDLYRSSSSGGTSWGTPVSQWTGTTTKSVGCNVYTRSGDVVLAYLYENDSDSLLYYDEYTISTGGTEYTESPTMTGTGTLSLTREIQLAKSYTATGTESLTKTASYLKTLTHSGTGTLGTPVKAVTKDTFGMSGTGTSSLTKGLQYQQSPTMTATGTNVLSKTADYLRTFTYTGTGAESLTKTSTLARSFSYTATGTESLTKTADYLRTFTYTGTGTESLTKTADYLRTLTYTGTGTNSLTKGLQYQQSPTMSATGTNVLSKTADYLRSLTYSGTGTNTLSKIGQYERSFGYSGTGTSNTPTKDVSLDAKTYSATGSLAFSQGLFFDRSFSMSGIGASALTKLLAYTKTLNQTGTGTSTLTREIGYNFSYTGVGTSSVTQDVTYTLSFSSGATGTLGTPVKAITLDAKTFSATGSLVFTQGLFYDRIFTPTATGTNALTKTITFDRQFSYSGVGTLGTPVKAVELSKTYSAVGSLGTPLKAVDLSYTYTGTGTASLTKGLAFEENHSMSATGSVTFADAVNYVDTFIYSGVGTPSIVRQIEVSFTSTAVGTAAIQKAVELLKTYNATGSVVETDEFQTAFQGNMTATGTVVFAKQFNEGGGGGEVANTITQTTLKGEADDREIYRIIHIYSDGSEETDLVVYDNSAFVGNSLRGRLMAVWAMGSAGVTRLEWDQTADYPAISVDPSNGIHYDFTRLGGIPNPGGAGATGDLVLSTSALDLDDELTLIIQVNQD